MEQQSMYHYTNPDGWYGIQNMNQGIKPLGSLIPSGIDSSLVPLEARSPAIFGLFDPAPQSWTDYRDDRFYFCDVWHHLLIYCARERGKLVLLKINLIEADKPLVFDFVHIRRRSLDLAFTKDLEKCRRISAERYRDYWNSRVELNRYEGNFTLPEIVVFSPIPKPRVEFIAERDLVL